MIKEIQDLKEKVYQANLALPKAGLVKLTWGNVSTIDRDLGVIVIKPSGLSYERMTADSMVVTDLDGNSVEEGQLNPSSDLLTHIVLYKNFVDIKAIVHTHSKWAVSWAQAGRDIPAYGTTHADAFYGSIPCTRVLTENEVHEGYESNTGYVIVETFKQRKIDPLTIPGVITASHGPFTWGTTANKAVENSIILDEVADMAFHAELLNRNIPTMGQYLLDKHYNRKHGKNAYYGQGEQ